MATEHTPEERASTDPLIAELVHDGVVIELSADAYTPGEGWTWDTVQDEIRRRFFGQSIVKH